MVQKSKRLKYLVNWGTFSDRVTQTQFVTESKELIIQHFCENLKELVAESSRPAKIRISCGACSTIARVTISCAYPSCYLQLNIFPADIDFRANGIELVELIKKYLGVSEEEYDFLPNDVTVEMRPKMESGDRERSSGSSTFERDCQGK